MAATVLLIGTAAHAGPLQQSGWQDAQSAQSGDQIALSCVSASWCLSVCPGGTQVWDGSAWSQAAAGFSSSFEVAGLSCWSRAHCVVVGRASTPVAMRWNGTTWAKLHPPTRHPAETGFNGISCPALKTCVLVGDLASRALRWHNGTWTSQRIPRPSGTTSIHLYAIDCPTVRSCHALGELGYRTPPRIPKYALLTWTGSSWKTHVLSGVSLRAISCASAVACVAVGENSTHMIGYSWNGSTWRTSVVPDSPNKYDNAQLEPNGYEQLTSVSCWAATGCQAVGVTNSAPFHRIWNGQSWSSLANPESTDGTSSTSEATYDVNDIACAGSSSCLTSGGVTYGTVVGQTYMEKYEG